MQRLYSYIRALWRGFLLRCPNCGRGRMFRGLFEMEKTCPICQVRFERQSGESIGGMVINLALAEVITLGGFFLVDALFHVPITHQLIFWIPFTILFCIFFYRHARAMWVGVAFLVGGVYRDEEHEEMKKG
jgi:uncharacterized protein (DUF983 family)